MNLAIVSHPCQHRRAMMFALVSIVILVAVLAALPVRAATLERVAESGKIRIGYSPDARPFSFQTEAGQAAGYSVALCREIAKKVQADFGLAQLTTEVVPVSNEAGLQAVQQGTIDLLCGATTVTLAERQKVSFSLPIFLSGIGALVRADAPAQLRAVLAGEEPGFRPRWRASYAQILQQRTFSAHEGTTAAAWLTERIDEFGIIVKVAPVANYDDGVRRVLERQTDVFFGDRDILIDTALRSPHADDLLVTQRQFTHETIALALARGDEDFRLLVDQALSQLYRRGEITALYKTYFGEPNDSALVLFSWAALPD